MQRLVIVAFVAFALVAPGCSCTPREEHGRLDPSDAEGLEALCYEDGGLSVAEDICHFRASLLVGKPYARPWDRLATPRFPSGVAYADKGVWDGLIRGTDLGVTARVGDETYLFFGDTAPVENDGVWTGPVYGLPIGVDTDGDLRPDAFVEDPTSPSEYLSVTQAAAYDEDGEPTGLLNDRERELMESTDEPVVEFPFFVPTGAVAIGDTIYLWYGKYINNTYCDQSHLLAMDAPTGAFRYIAPFAEQRFIQVAAVPVAADEADWERGACPPPFSTDDEEGLLLFGTGPPIANDVGFDEADPWDASCAVDSAIGYRESRLYLAYMALEDLESDDPAGAAWYFAGKDTCWRRGDLTAARPVTGDPGLGEFDVRRVPGTDLLLMVGGSTSDAAVDWASGKPEYWSMFGPAMLARGAALTRPWEWSSPKGALSFGYGMYLPEGHIEYFPDRAIDGVAMGRDVVRFARVVSSWPGGAIDPDLEEYGVSAVWSVMEIGDWMDGAGQ